MFMHKNPDTRLTIKMLLEKNGYSVIEVISFNDFLKKIKISKPDLILINGLMPRDEMTKIAQKKGVNVVYFSSSNINQKELKLYKNVLGFIDEPRDIKKFLKDIKNILKEK